MSDHNTPVHGSLAACGLCAAPLTPGQEGTVLLLDAVPPQPDGTSRPPVRPVRAFCNRRHLGTWLLHPSNAVEDPGPASMPHLRVVPEQADGR